MSIDDNLIDKIAVAISGAPFPTASSQKRARKAIEAYESAKPEQPSRIVATFNTCPRCSEETPTTHQPEDYTQAFEKFKQEKIPKAGAAIHCIAEEAFKSALSLLPLAANEQRLIEEIENLKTALHTERTAKETEQPVETVRGNRIKPSVQKQPDDIQSEGDGY